MFRASLVVFYQFQGIVNHLWSSLAGTEQHDLRQFLVELLTTRSSNLSLFIRNKLIQVVVLIGRVDWPHAYPEFMTLIMQVSGLVCL